MTVVEKRVFGTHLIFIVKEKKLLIVNEYIIPIRSHKFLDFVMFYELKRFF